VWLSEIPASPASSSGETIGFHLNDFLDEIQGSALLEVNQLEARSWLVSLESGGAMPDRAQLIGLISGMLNAQSTPTPREAGDIDNVRLVQSEPVIGHMSKFPHHVDTSTGEPVWQQCKTKMTHIEVKLQNGQGEPVDGSKLQQGGLELRLTLLNAKTMEPLSDNHNPRPSEGHKTLLGPARGPFEPTVKLMESKHEFRFQVLLLSSDIQSDKMCVQVKPVRPDLAAREGLTVTTKSFTSRARMPGRVTGKRSRQAVENDYQDLSVFDLYAGDLASGGGEPTYRSAGCFGDDEEEEDDDGERPTVVPPAARIQNLEARTTLEGMLDKLESGLPLPTGRALLEALRMCRIGTD